MIKELISNPSLFALGPSLAGGLTGEDGNTDDWSDFQGLSSTDVVHSSVQNSPSTEEFHPSSSPNDGDWADFRSTSTVAVSDPSHSVHQLNDTVQASLPTFDTERSSVKTYPGAASWFGIQQNNYKPSRALFSSGALDFSPPELPPENDDDDTNDLGFYSVPGIEVGIGISSLLTCDLEDEPVDGGTQSGAEDFLKAGIQGMTTSTSMSSFEFTGWQHSASLRPGQPAPAPDTQSTGSLDLRPALDVTKRSQAEADSQSEGSYELAPQSETARMPASGIVGTDFDRMSVQSLELKSAVVSPDEEPVYSIGRDDGTGQSLGSLDSVPVNTGKPTSCHSVS